VSATLAPAAKRVRHFVSLGDLSPGELERLLIDALALKRERDRVDRPLRGRSLAMIFEKPSLRTRVSFEMAMVELGGHATYLSPAEVGLGRRESVADVARVVSRYVDLIVLRTFAHETTEEFARWSSVPVINGLSDRSHPCQGLADVLTIRERKGNGPDVVVTYIGDGNNVCHSLMRIAARFGVEFVAATPAGYEPSAAFVEAAAEDARASGGSVSLITDPREAARGAHAVYTDVWVSMGQDADREHRLRDLEPYRIDADLLALADGDAVAMHCLPAHVGEEIAADVLYGARCLAWEQAENRLHTQKALMALVIR